MDVWEWREYQGTTVYSAFFLLEPIRKMITMVNNRFKRIFVYSPSCAVSIDRILKGHHGE